MTNSDNSLNMAAGGLLIRYRGVNPEIALVHRERHGPEWALPKGKLQEDEDWQQAALREVQEETGFAATPVRLFSCNQYSYQAGNKLVIYWLMHAGEKTNNPDPDEITEVAWLSLDAAAERLTHDEQRKLVLQLQQELSGLPLAIEPAQKRHFFLSSEGIRRDRLATAIINAREDLQHRLIGKTPAATSWARPASELLNQATIALENDDIDSGWSHVNSARRKLLYAMDSTELEQQAEILRQESVKLSGWRQASIAALLGKPDASHDRPYQQISVERVEQCSLIQDGHHENIYMKIAVRRTNLKRMFVILLVIALAFPLLACFTDLPAPLNGPWSLLLLEGFGALGAAFSVAISLTKRPLSDAIPEQLIGSFITWMRPLIGAVAALAAYVFLRTGWLPEIFADMEYELSAILALGFVAGFSERLVVGVIEKKTSNDNA